MSTPEAEITICGPGGCINNELAIIEDALRRAGYTVEVKNDSPQRHYIESRSREGVSWTPGELFTPAEQLAWATGRAGGLVKIKMEHMPWGG